MKALAIVAFAACSSSPATPPECPDGGPACGSACIAAFAGNFVDKTSSPTNCAMVMPGTGSASADTLLAFNLESSMIAAPVAVTIDLGVAPTVGQHSSETIASWSALALRSNDSGQCVFSAGDGAVPPGSFTLQLTSLDGATAHGTIEIIQYVQAAPATDCGAGDTETIDGQF